jgi:hypothetical protein
MRGRSVAKVEFTEVREAIGVDATALLQNLIEIR